MLTVAAAIAGAVAAVVAAGPAPPVAAPAPVTSGAPAAGAQLVPAPPSVRLTEVLRFDCANQLRRREVTLFGNGTIRLRDGPLGKEWMGLAELAPDEMEGTLRRLAAEDLSNVSHAPQGVVGDWIEKCDLVLELPSQNRQKFFFGRYDTLPLALYHLQSIAEELAQRVAVLRDAAQLPEGYEPRLGDVLRRTDGNRYRVVEFTSDHKGVELDGLDQPLHLLVLKEQMRTEFIALVSRER